MTINNTLLNMHWVIIWNNILLDRTAKYQYLRITLNQEHYQKAEINKRIEIARSAFMQMKSLLINKTLSLEIRTWMGFRYYYIEQKPGLWKNGIKRKQSFEIWTYRELLKIFLMVRVSNVLILFGPTMRGPKYGVLQLILQGKIKSKRSLEIEGTHR